MSFPLDNSKNYLETPKNRLETQKCHQETPKNHMETPKTHMETPKNHMETSRPVRSRSQSRIQLKKSDSFNGPTSFNGLLASFSGATRTATSTTPAINDENLAPSSSQTTPKTMSRSVFMPECTPLNVLPFLH